MNIRNMIFVEYYVILNMIRKLKYMNEIICMSKEILNFVL